MKVLLLLLASLATMQASIIPYLDGITYNGTSYDWAYSVILSGDQNFRNTRTGDFVEIVDFRGVTNAVWQAGALSVANVLISFQLSGPGSMPIGETDSAGIRNVVVRNGGASINGVGVDIDLGTLILTTPYSIPARGAFTSQAQKVADLSTTFNQGYVETPHERRDVPEPRTLALITLGGLCLLVGRFRHS